MLTVVFVVVDDDDDDDDDDDNDANLPFRTCMLRTSICRTCRPV